MADELKPYRATVDVTLAARDAAHAVELYASVGAELPEGVFLEGGELEAMEPEDVEPESPLANWLYGGPDSH